MIDFSCRVCRTPLQVDDTLSGKLVRCPNCRSTTTVPPRAAEPSEPTPRSERAPPPDVAPSAAVPPPPRPAAPVEVIRRSSQGGPGRRYGFNCPYCSSRLEATEAMGGTDGSCPTCGSTITIPVLDRFGRLIDPVTREIIKPDPHPVHAYAAAGERAPRVVRRPDGTQFIACPRCGAASPVTANNCGSCGMPFTIEGTIPSVGGSASGVCVTSLVLGIIGIPASCSVLVPVLAIGFGVVGLFQTRREGDAGRGFAIAGIVCGVVGLVLSSMIYLF